MYRVEIELDQRILILDGAISTMLKHCSLQEVDYRSNVFENHAINLKGNYDILNLTKPDIVKNIHLDYLRAGADIISTNTFGANCISQEDYQTAELVYDINYYGAQIAKEAVSEIQHKSVKPLFVAGAMGSTTKLASISTVVCNSGLRQVTFDQLVLAYTQQASALIAGGVDLFLLETITDTLNAKAALFALMQLFKEIGKEFPIMLSGTITDASGRTLSGQTLEAFLISIAHVPILSIGLNCALGAIELRPHIEVLNKKSSFFVSAHPNAGLPNQLDEYSQSPAELATIIAEFAQNGWLNIVGGCCGTTPEHVKAIAKALKGKAPRRRIKMRSNPSKGSLKITDRITRQIIENWVISTDVENRPTFSLKELTEIISRVEDERSFIKLKSAFDKEKARYHPEQAILLNAHISGRYQYLRTDSAMKN